MPSTTEFDKQSEEYKEAVSPKAVTARMAVEAAVTNGWYKYTGLEGKVIGMDGFGESAPAPMLYEHFNITAETVLSAISDFFRITDA